MATNVNTTTNLAVYNCQLVDVSTPSIAYIPIPLPGRLVEARCTIATAITVADSIVTVKKYPAGVVASAVTCGTITAAFTGAAIGSTFNLSLSGSEANCTFVPGDVLVFDSDGGSTTAAITTFSAVLRG